MLKTTADIRAYIAYYNYSMKQINETTACYSFNQSLSTVLQKEGNAPQRLINALDKAINDDLLQPIPTQY